MDTVAQHGKAVNRELAFASVLGKTNWVSSIWVSERKFV